MTLYTVASTIRAAGGVVWLIEFSTQVTIFRCDIGQRKARIIVPKPGQTAPLNIPVEKNSALHIVDSLITLSTWLRSLPV